MKKTITLVILMACLMITKPASATLLTLGGGWDTFRFYGIGSSFDGAWQFTVGAGDSSLLTVTDAYLSGDRFEIFNLGSSIGLTSIPTTSDDQIWGDFDAASADPRWSTGFFILGAGTYDISGIVTVSPHGTGDAAIKLDRYDGEPVVPEPASMLLLGSGLLGFAGLRRKKS